MGDFSQLSGGSQVAAIVGGIIGFLIVAAIGALILALINRIVNGYWPHYGRTFVTVIVAGIIAGLINYVIGLGLGSGRFWAREIIAIVVETLIGGVVMGAFVRRKDGAPLGFGHAARAYLILAIIGFLFAVGVRPLQQSMQAKMRAQQTAVGTFPAPAASADSQPAATRSAPTPASSSY